MATALGLATVFGISDFEGTYGTPAAIDRRLEILTANVQRQNTILQSEGISGDLTMMRKGSRRVVSARQATGDTVFELAKNGMGRLFQAMLGGTPTITQQGATPAWLQTHAFGSLTGKSVTMQRSLRDGAGTEVEGFTHHGCKVTSWELSVSVDAIPQLSLTWDCEDEDTTTATTTLTGLTAPTTSNFTFADVDTFTIGGVTPARILDVTITGDNGLKTDSFFLGSGGLKAEPEVTQFRTISGTFSAEFSDPATVYDRFVADTGVAMVLTFTGANISGSFDEELSITIPDIRFTGETPQVSGPDLIVQNAPFEAQYDGTNPPLTLTYQSTDTAV